MSRKDFGAKPYSFPQPVFIIASYDEEDRPCAMNAAWCGISEATEVSMCLSAEHKTTKNILTRGAFTISMADAAHVAECDYFGLVSGNKVKDKVKNAGLSVSRSSNVDAPMINELAVCIECKLISYDENTCLMKGEIVNVSVDESALTDGKVDVSKVAPITFDPFNNAYHVIGEKVGDAWNSGKKYV
jgi:flavin reductase (DIM6/NTAB) family NADH-FMN oxidoreductase RutF